MDPSSSGPPLERLSSAAERDLLRRSLGFPVLKRVGEFKGWNGRVYVKGARRMDAQAPVISGGAAMGPLNSGNLRMKLHGKGPGPG